MRRAFCLPVHLGFGVLHRALLVHGEFWSGLAAAAAFRFSSNAVVVRRPDEMPTGCSSELFF
jgi:hypothetical protein